MELRGLHLHNLKNLTLQIEAGKITNLRGPCGSGKSSIVKGTLARRGTELEQFLAAVSAGTAPLYLDDLKIDPCTNLPRTVLIDAEIDFQPNTPLALVVYDSRLLFETFVLAGEYACPTCAVAGRRSILRHWTPKSFLAACAEHGLRGDLLVGITIRREELPRVLELGLQPLPGADNQPDPNVLPELMLDRFSSETPYEGRLLEAFRTAKQLSALGLTVSSPGAAGADITLRVNLGSACACCGTKRALYTEAELTSAVLSNAEEINNVSYKGLSFGRLLEMSIQQAAEATTDPVFEALHLPLAALRHWKLASLRLSQRLGTLSSSEAYRLRLALHFNQADPSRIVLLDGPSVYLSDFEMTELFDRLKQIRAAGNSIVVADNHPCAEMGSDRIIELGPAGGNAGGALVAMRPGGARHAPSAPLKPVSPTGCGKTALSLSAVSIGAATFSELELSGPGLYALSGEPASGKSRLLFDALPKLLQSALAPAQPGAAPSLGVIERIEGLKRTRIIRLFPNYVANSTVASILGLLTPLAEFMARLETARMQGLTPAQIKKAPHTSTGKSLVYRGLNLTEILSLSINDAMSLLSSIPKCRRELKLPQQLGVGHLALNQEAQFLGDGERRRLNLAQGLKFGAAGTLFLIERPAADATSAEIATITQIFADMAAAGAIILMEESRRELLSKCLRVWNLEAG
ncbi:MAG: hypothetical protein K1X83_07485 [Oligoflexia bacterium]|nr:hypothetical protein [Oligoflexia bacterium]